MNNVQKMLLVPAHAIDRFKSGAETAIGRNLNDLDWEMQKILNSSNKSDYDKYLEYNQVMHKYLGKYNKSREPVEIPIVEEQANALPPVEPVSTVNNTQILDHLLDSFSSKHPYRKKASALYKILDKTPEITWDANGQVSIKNQVIQNSNILDLLVDVVRARQTKPPQGWDKFATLLSELNIPREFIGNPKRLDYLENIYLHTPLPDEHSEPLKSQSRKKSKRIASATKVKWSKFKF